MAVRLCLPRHADNLTATNTSGFSNIYLRELATGKTIWVSHALDGSAPNDSSDTPTISGDGNLIAFLSSANNLVGYDAKSLSGCVSGRPAT